jgi:hypothetical protein
MEGRGGLKANLRFARGSRARPHHCSAVCRASFLCCRVWPQREVAASVRGCGDPSCVGRRCAGRGERSLLVAEALRSPGCDGTRRRGFQGTCATRRGSCDRRRVYQLNWKSVTWDEFTRALGEYRDREFRDRSLNSGENAYLDLFSELADVPIVLRSDHV